MLVLRLVPVQIGHLDLGIESVQVDQGVDAGVLECAHAAVVVAGGLDVVDADRVGAEVGHQLGVAAALLRVDERVVLVELVRNACMCVSAAASLASRDLRVPLMKNWLPDSSKNLEPVIESLEMAVTSGRNSVRAAAAAEIERLNITIMS